MYGRGRPYRGFGYGFGRRGFAGPFLGGFLAGALLTPPYYYRPYYPYPYPYYPYPYPYY